MIHYFLCEHANISLDFFLANLFNRLKSRFHAFFQLIELEFDEVSVWESLLDLDKNVLEDDHKSLLQLRTIIFLKHVVHIIVELF